MTQKYVTLTQKKLAVNYAVAVVTRKLCYRKDDCAIVLYNMSALKTLP